MDDNDKRGWLLKISVGYVVVVVVSDSFSDGIVYWYIMPRRTEEEAIKDYLNLSRFQVNIQMLQGRFANERVELIRYIAPLPFITTQTLFDSSNTYPLLYG